MIVRFFVLGLLFFTFKVSAQECPDCPKSKDSAGLIPSSHLGSCTYQGLGHLRCIQFRSGTTTYNLRCFKWADFHCDQIRQLRIRAEGLEAALEEQKQYLMGCDTTLKGEVSDKGKSLWEEINSLKNREIASLRQKNSQLENRIKKLEEIIGVDIEQK